MAGRTEHDRHLSTHIAAALWAGSVLTTLVGSRRLEPLLLAAAATATIVDAIQRAQARDVSEAHWSGLAAGRDLERGQASAVEAC